MSNVPRIFVDFLPTIFEEKGVNEPQASYILALSDYFNVTADYLLGKTKY